MNLSSRHVVLLNRGLIAAQVSLLISIFWVGATAIGSKANLATSVAAPPPPTSQPTTSIEVKTLTWYSPIWTRDLRQSPIDPKPPPATVVATPPPPAPPKVKLLGTVVEAQDRYGVFMDSSSRLAVRRLKEKIDEYQILDIERGRAQIKSAGQTVWLTMPDFELRTKRN